MRKQFLAAIVAVAGIIAASAGASAQAYPDKTIKFIVPFAAGSATDTLARVLGEQLGKAQGWQVVVENIAGANGTIAARTVARAAPDGYTVLISTNTTHAAAQSLMKSVPYDHIADFEHLTRIDGLAAAAAHELGTPLSTIFLISRELEKSVNGNEQLAADLKTLREQAQRCRDILAKITQLSAG